MVDQRTMVELLHAPAEGYAEAIVVPLILADQFELKHSLINMMTTNQFFGLENDNHHDHIRCTTYSSNPLLEELADELTLITFLPKYDDDLQFDAESDLKEIEFLLHQDIDSSLKDSIDQSNLANHADNFVDYVPEMFTDEHALDYSSLLIFDEYDDDFLEVESNAENVYDDPFDSKGEKIKESKLLIDELDLPCDFLPFEYDSFISLDFSRVDALPSTNKEDKYYRNLKNHAEGFCPPVFISSASLGNHVSKSNRANVYLMAYLINGLRFT
nr:reverse transcriptase domain-containing protein [Tanacetum cinerariifolium]